MTKSITQTTDFLLALDDLKLVQRKTAINGGERLENSAEHSWHLAMACWAFAELFEEDYDKEKLLQLALIHDVGEIDAGDTFLYSDNRQHAAIAERQGVEKLANHEGNPIVDFLSLWDEQELGHSKEAQLIKVVDRLLPILHNLQCQGGSWQTYQITKRQVLKKIQFIEATHTEIFQWLCQQLDTAVQQGWLSE